MLRILLLLPLLAAVPARGGEPVDLTEYLAPRPAVGDYKVWKGSGIVGTMREDVVAVDDVEDGGYRIERSYSDVGVEIARSEQLVTPGVDTTLRWLAGGRALEGAPLLGVGETWPLSLRERKRARYKLFDSGPQFPIQYETITRGSHRFEGFDDWDESGALHPLAAILTTRSATRTRRSSLGSWGWTWSPRVDLERSDRGFVSGVGLIGATATYRITSRGVVRKRIREDLELVSAVVQGVAYPPAD
jgi:hypothetical protein